MKFRCYEKNVFNILIITKWGKNKQAVYITNIPRFLLYCLSYCQRFRMGIYGMTVDRDLKVLKAFCSYTTVDL